MSRAVRLSEGYAAAWVRLPDGSAEPWLFELDPMSFVGLPIGAAFEVPISPPPGGAR